MNASEKLLEYLPDPNSVKGGVAEVVERMQQEAPLVIDELLRWTIVYNLIWFVLCVAVMVVVMCVIGRLFRWVGRQGADDDAVIFFGGILPILVFIFSAVGAMLHLGWIKPWVAPRLFLLEYFANMIK